MRQTTPQRYFFLALLLLTIVLLTIIFYPFIGILVLAVTMAVVFYPVHSQILWLVNGRRSTAALVSTFTLLVIIIGPMVFFGFLIFNEARILYHSVSGVQGLMLSETLSLIGEKSLKGIFPNIDIDVAYHVRQMIDWLFSRSGPAFLSFTRFILGLFLSVIALYYFLKDGDRLLRAATLLSPLPDNYDKKIIERLNLTLHSVVRGSLIIALLQGTSTGLGLIIFGVPNAILWGSVGILASFIPALGTAIILVPAAVYLLLIDRPWAAVGILIWSATAVGMLDNLIAPKLIERGIQIHPLLILLAILGSIGLFGVFGVLIGPLLLSLLFALLGIYPLVFPKAKKIINGHPL